MQPSESTEPETFSETLDFRPGANTQQQIISVDEDGNEDHGAFQILGGCQNVARNPVSDLHFDVTACFSLPVPSR